MFLATLPSHRQLSPLLEWKTFCLLLPLQCDDLSSSHAALEQDLKSSKEECDSLKSNLKKVVEMKRKMEWQRDDAGRQLDDLEEKLEVGSPEIS